MCDNRDPSASGSWA